MTATAASILRTPWIARTRATTATSRSSTLLHPARLCETRRRKRGHEVVDRQPSEGGRVSTDAPSGRRSTRERLGRGRQRPRRDSRRPVRRVVASRTLAPAHPRLLDQKLVGCYARAVTSNSTARPSHSGAL